MTNKPGGVVTAVSRSGTHTMSKPNQESIQLLTGLGVADDAHQGETVKHRSRVQRDPTQPNLRQVHLIHAELHDERRDAGFAVSPGQMGETANPAVSICSDCRSGHDCSWVIQPRSR